MEQENKLHQTDSLLNKQKDKLRETQELASQGSIEEQINKHREEIKANQYILEKIPKVK